eukprot:TRINITY_DN19126_c0_g1_i1.p1 TRINITY_DN19126_c0_g1~~TRINITY_DN19126_c0_g1_i1.p1  ORF type:complete len:603 (+),score=275.98 TRINITY_DN19126_c0_g1_i1:246-1811(+)
MKKVMGGALSRKGTYVALWTVPELEGKKENLFVYRVATSELLGSLWAPHWPCIDWFADESCAVFYHLLSGISFYEDISKPPTANVPGRWNVVSLSPTSPATVFAVSIPGEKERDTTPTKVRVFRYPKVTKDLLSYEIKVDSADVQWNKKGTSALLNAGLDADRTGRSYYGEAALFLFNVQDKKITPIPTGNTPIHDVQWNGNGKEFIIVYGKMPANEAKLIDEKGALVHKFDVSPKNTVHWSPNSRFFMLAGFGNLPGDMVMYDREKLGKGGEVVGRCSSSSVTRCMFSPDSRYFLCATCHPRMTTANRMVLFRVNGEKVAEKDFKELYEVHWRPYSVKAFSQDQPLAPAAAPKAASSAAKPAPKATAFRAAGRNPGFADAIKNQLSAPKKAGYSSTKVSTSFSSWREEEKPKTAKEAAAAKVIGASVVGLPPAEEKKEKKPKKECEVEQNAPIDYTTKSYPDVSKALKAAKKKVEQCGQLNNKAAADLQADQINKLKDFNNFKAEVKYLEALAKAGKTSQ